METPLGEFPVELGIVIGRYYRVVFAWKELGIWFGEHVASGSDHFNFMAIYSCVRISRYRLGQFEVWTYFISLGHV